MGVAEAVAEPEAEAVKELPQIAAVEAPAEISEPAPTDTPVTPADIPAPPADIPAPPDEVAAPPEEVAAAPEEVAAAVEEVAAAVEEVATAPAEIPAPAAPAIPPPTLLGQSFPLVATVTVAAL